LSPLLRQSAANVSQLERDLAERLAEQLAMSVGHRPAPAERRSWERSIPVLAADLVDAGLGSVEMLLEYKLPLSSKRADVVLAGFARVHMSKPPSSSAGVSRPSDERCSTHTTVAVGVTDTGIQGLLEAAHISPYKGDHTDKVTNGPLLRADIHALFDLHLLTVLPDYTVRLAPEVRTEPYAPCEGGRIRVPGHRPHRPDPEVLRERNSACRWLHERAPSEGVLF
jgi:hypothetical protein